MILMKNIYRIKDSIDNIKQLNIPHNDNLQNNYLKIEEKFLNIIYLFIFFNKFV